MYPHWLSKQRPSICNDIDNIFENMTEVPAKRTRLAKTPDIERELTRSDETDRYECSILRTKAKRKSIIKIDISML